MRRGGLGCTPCTPGLGRRTAQGELLPRRALFPESSGQEAWPPDKVRQLSREWRDRPGKSQLSGHLLPKSSLQAK